MDTWPSRIQFNDMADCLTHDIYTGILSAPSFITYNDAVKIAADISTKSWQRKWDHNVAGSYTRQLIPTVGSKVSLPQNRNVGISYRRLLLHDIMLCNDSHRTSKFNTPSCECGLERETADHFLLHCVRFQDARNKLNDSSNDISELSRCKRQLQHSDNRKCTVITNNNNNEKIYIARP